MISEAQPDPESDLVVNTSEASDYASRPFESANQTDVEPSVVIPDANHHSETITEIATIPSDAASVETLQEDIEALKQQKQALELEIKILEANKARLVSEQLQQVQNQLGRMLQESVIELEQRRQGLQISIEQLEKRRDRIREEMRTTFAGVSQELAIRVQGFKDYLVGSLQDLVVAAEQLDFPTKEQWSSPPSPQATAKTQTESGKPQFGDQEFGDKTKRIQKILDQYRTLPDYYGPPWQLRRTFEPIHAERVQKWFFDQGGRGAIRTMGSRLQNILIASASISVLHSLYGDRIRTLVLANTPERLGEWRRGLQDCLGISRSDFGPERGITLFESPEALVQKADRLVEQKALPLVIIDETEDNINLALLQFPLWLAFAPDFQQPSNYMF